MVTDGKTLAQSAIDGKLDVRIDATKHNGEFKVVLGGFNNTLDSVIRPLNVAAEYVDRISKGDIPPKITDNYNGDFNEIKNNLNQCIDAINLMVTDGKMLAQAAIDGKLDTRCDASKHNGEFKVVLGGFNNTLDSIIKPLNLMAEYVDRISKGDIPPKITDEYKGDFNEVKNNLNQCIDAINLMVTDGKTLAQSAIEGKLDVRINASKHNGEFKVVLGGFNSTLDSVIGPLNVAAEYMDRISKGDIPPKITDKYNGDFNEIKNNLNQCIDAVNILVADAVMLAKAAEEGKLHTRADASKHGGDFRAIVDGVNKTLDSVIEPINEAGQVLEVMSTGNLTVRMKGEYKGDNQKLKNSINALGNSLTDVIVQVNDTVQTSASSAFEISSTAESLAAASQEQSAQADEVASAVEEMSRTVSDNAQSAGRTADLARKNGEIATDGAKVVKQTVGKMKDIADVVKTSANNIQKLGESSKEIGEIISVIDDIADQTNLLALNAAIEAARAGEQGRGFAVVADEVRKLAERTTEATKQIAKMIKGIQAETDQAVVAMNRGTVEVQNGIDLADKAGESLNDILSSSQEVLDMINQIAAASEEQSATSEQISKNVMSISKVTGESAQRIEDVARTSEELAKLTEQLRNLMAQFQVEGNASYSYSPTKQLDRKARKHLTA
jgi:methyl-accepting chemotaxis protein